MVREFAGMMSQELGRQPSLMIVLLNMLEVTLLGAFPGPRQRPAWRARLSVRRSMHMDGFRLYTWCAGCHRETHAACPLCPGGSVPTARSGAHKNHLCPMCAYVRANKYFIFFAIKEMYVFYVRRNGVINTLLEQEAGWIEHWSLLLRALDDARQIVSDVFVQGGVHATAERVRDALQRASAHMALLHDCNKPTMMHMSKEIYFWQLLLAKMSRHHTMEIVAPFWTGCQEPGDFLMAPRREADVDLHAFPRTVSGIVAAAAAAAAAASAAAEPIALTKSGVPKKKQKKPTKMRNAVLMARVAPQFYECDVPLAHLGGRRWCDVHTLDEVERVARFCAADFGDLMPSMLASVGMAPAAVTALQEMMHNSRVREMPDNQLQERCEKLRRAPHTPVDFHLLHHFLRCMEREHAIGCWPLDLEQARAQARALRLRHRLAPWETLPLAATHVFVCRNDERVFANIVEPAEHTERDEALRGDGTALPLRKKVIAARGVTDAYYCHERGALMCPKDIDSSMCRELRKRGQQRVMWMHVATHPDAKKQAAIVAEAKKNANSIRESLQSSRACATQRLESINLLGRVWRVGSRAITLCVRCGSVCYWQDSCMTSEGMTCVVAGTQVALADGTSRAIETLVDEVTLRANARIAVPRVSEDGTAPRLTETTVITAFSSGTKNCVRLTLEDGRTLDLTPEHRLMTADGVWVEAKDLQVGTTRLAVAGIDYVPDEATVNESAFVLQAGDYTLRMNTPTTRAQTLTFSRLLGFTLADGWISASENASSVSVGQIINRDAIIRDAELFGGSTNTFSEEGSVWKIYFRATLAIAFRSLNGIQTGRRINGEFTLPVFLFAASTPISVVREFVAGFFGGDGGTVSRNIQQTKQDHLQHVYLKLHALVTNVHHMRRFMEQIRDLLGRCGVDVGDAHINVNDPSAGSYPAAQNGIARKEVTLRLTDSLSFAERVGFRYCVQKSQRLAAACVWFRLRDRSLRQRKTVLERIVDIYDSGVALLGANQGKRRRTTSWKECIEQAIEELHTREPILLRETMPRAETSGAAIRSALQSVTMGQNNTRGVDKFAILKEARCEKWFDAGYIVQQRDQTLPLLALKVVDRRDIGMRAVFDLSASEHHAFIANGVAVHNCGREVRFAPRARFTELRQFVTPASQQLRTAQPGTTLIEMRETMLCAPRATETRADIFTRTRTPVFDDTREYDRLSLIHARLQIKAAAPPAGSTPPLVGVEDGVTLMINSFSGGGGAPSSASASTVRARPRLRRPGYRRIEQQIADAISAGGRASATEAERTEREELLRVRDELARAVTDDDVARIFERVQSPLASALIKNQESLLNEERRTRDALPFAEQHRARPHNYDEQEWQALAEDERFFAWTFEGRAHRTALLYAQAQLTSDREEKCERLVAAYAKQVEQWRADHFFEARLAYMRDCDVARAQVERVTGGAAQAFASDAFAGRQLDDMRRFFIGLGAMPVRYEVCCAFCRTVCDPKGAYCSLWVVNLDRLLVDPRTNVPLDERGLVRIFLCANCFDKVQYNLLRAKPLPLASDVFLHIQAQRARARDQYLRKKK